MFGLHWVFWPHFPHQFGCETGNTREDELFAFRKCIANPEVSVVRNTNNVAGPGLFREFAILCQKQQWIVRSNHFTAADMLQFHAAPKFTGTYADECDTVAVFCIHIRLNLEDEATDFLFIGRNLARRGRLRPRRRCIFADAFQQLAELEEDGEALVRVANLHLEMGRWQSAEQELQRAIDLGLEEAGSAYLLLGIVLAEQDKYKESFVALRRARGFDKTQRQAAKWLTYAQDMRKQFEWQQAYRG